MSFLDEDSSQDFFPAPQTPHNSCVPYARIVEQPAKCGVRFRYECEGRISGAIPGQHSSPLRPTFPAIKVFNFDGRAKVVVSCVTKNPPFRAHPHNLVGKKSCRDGVCHVLFNSQDTCSFNNLGILCAKRKDIRERLRVRESLRVDPFQLGFAHKTQAFKVIDLAVVRLCFQVYLESEPNSNDFSIALEPLVSDPIYDKKAMSELSISKLSHYSASASGGQEMILLCDRVVKDDIQIRFYEEVNDHVVWEAFADFKSNDIHKHFAISFRSPKYSDPSAILQPRPIQVQLRRPSDGQCSESLPFFLLPVRNGSDKQKRAALQRQQQQVVVTPTQPMLTNQSDQFPLPLEGDKIDFFSLDYYMTSEMDETLQDVHWSADETPITAAECLDQSAHLLDISERHVTLNNWSQQRLL